MTTNGPGQWRRNRSHGPVCMGSHLGLAVPVECVSLEHEPAAAPARAHEAPGHLAEQEPAITVGQAQLPT